MNKSTNPKEMDVHYKDGVCRCKHCGRTKIGKWPITILDLRNGVVQAEIEAFKLAHTQCAYRAYGHNTN